MDAGKPENKPKKHALTPEMEKRKWKPGQSGNPGGRPRKRFQEAIERNLKPKDEDQIAREVIKRAKKGDAKFVFELRDMFDGKPVQQLSGPDGGAIPVNLEGIDDAIRSIVQEIAERNK